MSPSRAYKLFSLLLAIVVLFNTSGIYLAGKIETMRHREASKEQVENENSVTLHFTTEELSTLHWVGERDFIYNGNHYDIHRFEMTGTHCRIICEHDTHETALQAVMEKQLGHDHGTDTKHTAKSWSAGLDCILQEHIVRFADVSSSFIFPESSRHNTRAAFILFHSPPPEA